MSVSDPKAVATPAGWISYAALAPGADRLQDPPHPRAVWQTGEFGCFEACIATLLGVDLADVPPGPPGEHTKVQELYCLERVHAWVRARGYRLHYREITRDLWNRYWIGVSVDPRPGFNHTVICRGRRLVFDPALAVPVPAGCEVERVQALHYAITLDRLENA